MHIRQEQVLGNGVTGRTAEEQRRAFITKLTGIERAGVLTFTHDQGLRCAGDPIVDLCLG